MSLTLFALYLTILMSGSETAGGQCKPSEKSANGKALKGHTFKDVAVKAIIECQNLCESDHRCHSYNYYIPGMVCEMNSETKETKPYDFVTDDQRFYMKREDDDECMSSPSVCDANANCENTLDSYSCSCKVGFYGDGKTCADIDECAAAIHNCSSDAVCNNTKGGYNCSCTAGFFGDGRNCSVIKCGTIFDFENGLSGWTLTGTAFNNQPTYGDNPTARSRGQPSNHKGDWWIGSFENRPSPSKSAGAIQGDGPQGSITSPSFVIVGNSYTFLIGGGCEKRYARAELIIEGNVVLNETGNCSETMTEKSWDVLAYTGKQAQLRLIDSSPGIWHHINFDHFNETCL